MVISRGQGRVVGQSVRHCAGGRLRANIIGSKKAPDLSKSARRTAGFCRNFRAVQPIPSIK